LVKTPDRRKETQVCHINMLKTYYQRVKPELVTLITTSEKENPSLVGPTRGEDCPIQDADVECEISLGNDRQPIKLQNSQILNDLDSKLSHLDVIKREELAEVIRQYEGIFPDVPNKTNVMEHDVDVGEASPIKQHPYRVSPTKRELLDKEIKRYH